MWEIELYQKLDGKCPVADFIRSLQADEKVRVDAKIKLLSKMGNTMDRNHGAYLRDDIYELRVKTRYGHIRLLYFFFRKSIIVITNGLHKKTQKVPDPEIKRAIQYREDYLSRH